MNISPRAVAIDRISEIKAAAEPVLLSWAVHPRKIPPEVAIPGYAWKGPEVMGEHYPAAAALVRIGPEAAAAAIEAYDRPLARDQRLLFIWVVGQVPGTPKARDFLSRAASDGQVQLDIANRGLGAIGGR